MSIDDVLKISASIIMGFGGVAAIFTAVVRYSSNIIAERLSKKYELKMSKELERYKTALGNKTYISKTKFDAEFAIYRELSSCFADAVKSVSILIPPGFTTVPADREDRLRFDECNYKVALPAVVKAQDALKANIPFVSEEIYNGYNELLGLFRLQLGAYEDRFIVNDLRPQVEKEVFSHDDYNRAREISEKWLSINSIVRNYLNSLDVIHN